MASTYLTPTERFWASVEQNENGCLIWQGTYNWKGYGQFHFDRQRVPAHRFAYENQRGPVPSGLQLDHLCRVRGCVNPDHLEAVTLTENLRRGQGFTGVNFRKSHCIHGHPLTGTNLSSDGAARRCLTCHRVRQQALRDRVLRRHDAQPGER